MVRIVSNTGILLGISIVCFALSEQLWFSLLFIAIAGLSQMLHTASTNTLLQLYTDDDKRGRVMSFYTVCLQGTMPLGSLAAGSIAGIAGGPWAMGIMGGICLVAALMYRKIHPRSEEHTSELQSLMRISYAVFCLKK